jgi:hypothetical protein
VTTRPTHGVRFAVERAEGAEGALVYRGHAHLPDADLGLEVRLEAGGGKATATIGDAGERSAALVAALELAAARLVRSAAKGEAPPRKIVRWRELQG